MRQPEPKEGGPLGVVINLAGAPSNPAQIDRTIIDFTRSLEYLYPKVSIRCCGLATGACENQYGRAGSVWGNGEHAHGQLGDAVNALVRCIEDDDIPGGEILHVVKGRLQPIAFSESISFPSGAPQNFLR